MAWPDSVLNGVKSAADATVGKINTATRILLEMFDPSNMNIFDCLITPEDIFSLDTATDAAITKIYLQSITIPNSGFSYENVNERKYLSGIERPESVTFKFIDNELAFVRLWLNNWKESIYNSTTETFADDQKATRKNAIVIPQTKLGVPQPAWVEMRGLQLKSIGDFTHEQGSGEPMMIDVTCKVDLVRFMTLF